MIKIRILDTCPHCKGQAYLPAGKDVDAKGNEYDRYRPCPHCEGTGVAGRWVELPEFLLMLDREKCPHQKVSRTGGFHYSNGDCWDDIREVCDDCGQVL
jgi:DnaJ-class molecular chaperone